MNEHRNISKGPAGNFCSLLLVVVEGTVSQYQLVDLKYIQHQEQGASDLGLHALFIS